MSSNQNRRKRIKILKANYMKSNPCLVCGSTKDLTFHHVNKIEKDLNIGGKSQLSVEKFFIEAEKCVVLCLRCHREHHEKEDASKRFI